MAELIAGTASVTIDGQAYPLVGDFAYRNSGEQREPKNGMDGFHGYKSKPIHGMIRMKLRNQGNVPVDVLNGVVDGTIVAELANGKTVIGRNMFRSGEPVTADAEEGELDITFEGPDVRD